MFFKRERTPIEIVFMEFILILDLILLDYLAEILLEIGIIDFNNISRIALIDETFFK